MESQNKMVFAVELGFTFYLSNWFQKISARKPPAPLFFARSFVIRSRNWLRGQPAGVSPHPRSVRKTVTDPHLVRCGLKAKVIRLQSYMAAFRLVQQHRQPQRPRLAFRQAPQQEFLGYAAFDHGIDQQDVATTQLRPRPKEINFAARMLPLPHVADALADKVANHRCVHAANQIGRKNETAVHGYDHVQAASVIGARNLPAYRLNARGNTRL